jgi:hypothetical protein
MRSHNEGRAFDTVLPRQDLSVSVAVPIDVGIRAERKSFRHKDGCVNDTVSRETDTCVHTVDTVSIPIIGLK